MPFQIVRDDITKMKTDAIVNSANPRPVIGGGTDRKIYEAAGIDKILPERERIGYMARGQARYTSAGKLKAKYIIHTVGPRWNDGHHGELEILRNCYRNSLALAKELRCKSVSFPLIASGVYGFPKDIALEIATDEFRSFLLEHDDDDMMICLVVFDDESFEISSRIYSGICDHISENFVAEKNCQAEAPKAKDLDALLESATETWQEKLMRRIRDSGRTEPEVYRAANISKALFSKIRKDSHYSPKRETVLALAIGLELDVEEAAGFLADAGYAFSNANRADIIVRHCLSSKNYNIVEINTVLWARNLPPLGSVLRDEQDEPDRK